eukprot:gene810-biopygen1599
MEPPGATPAHQQRSGVLSKQQSSLQHDEKNYQQKGQQYQQHSASMLTFPQFLQLPHEVIARAAACLPCKGRLQLGRLVLGRAAPTAAAGVLGTITKLYVQRAWCLSPHTATLDGPTFLNDLQCLQHLHLHLGMQPAAANNRPVGAALAVPSLTSLTGLTKLTSLRLTAVIELPWDEHDSCVIVPADKYEPERAWLLALLQAVGQMFQLQQLNVLIDADVNAAVTPAEGAFAALSTLTGLRSLKLQYRPGCRPLGLGQLSTLTGLTELSLIETQRASGEDGVARARRSALAAMAGVWPQLLCLQRLNLDNLAANFSSYPDIPVALQLPQPGNLTHLCLDNCQDFFPGFTAQLALLTGLQRLELSHCSGLSAGDLAAALPLMAGSLTYLDISYHYDELEGCFTTLTSLTRLAHLESRRTDLATYDDVRSWQYLSRLTSLTNLAVGSSRGMPAAGIACLSALTQLKELQVTGGVFQPDEAGLAAVFAPLAGTLTSLHLYDMKFVFPEVDDHVLHDKPRNRNNCTSSSLLQRLSVLLPGLKRLNVNNG